MKLFALQIKYFIFKSKYLPSNQSISPGFEFLLASTDLCILKNEKTYEPVPEISNNKVSAASKASDQPAHMRSLIRAFARR